MGRCTAQSKMLPFRANTIVRDSGNTELARLKKEKHLARFASSWFGTFAMFSCAAVVLLVVKTLEDEWYVVIKAYKLTVLRF